MQNLQVVCKHRWKYKVRRRCDCSGLVCSSFRRASSSSRCFYKNSWGPLHTEHTEKNITKFRILWRVYTSKAVSFCKNTVLTLKTWSSHQAMMSWCYLNKKKEETEIQSTFSFKRDGSRDNFTVWSWSCITTAFLHVSGCHWEVWAHVGWVGSTWEEAEKSFQRSLVAKSCSPIGQICLSACRKMNLDPKQWVLQIYPAK